MSGAFAPPSVGGGTVDWTVPGAIGSTTPNTGAFTSLNASTAIVFPPRPVQNLTATSTVSIQAGTIPIASTAPITLASSPQITTGSNGQKITVVNIGANAITFSNANNVSLPQSTVILYPGRSLVFTYFNVLTAWVLDYFTYESMALTGVSTAPTAGAGTATTQIASTAFVEGAVNPVWSGFTYQNAFADIAGFQAAQFTKVRGIVYVRGLSTRAVAGFTTGMVIATLPTGFRPAAKIRIPGDTFTNAIGNVIDIDTSGNILIYYNGTPTNITASYSCAFVPA
jgi:hypothetical protein